MSTLNLHRVFDPKTVALIGAGIRENSLGRAIMKNLASGGFEGKIFHVNPGPDAGGENKNDFPGLERLPEDIDLAVIATPLHKVPGILEVCAAKKMGGSVITASGPDSDNAADLDIVRKIKQISKKTGIRVIGPESVGVVGSSAGLNASYLHQMPIHGKVAFISQSSAVCTSILDMAVQENVGFSHFLSLGAMLDVSFADLIDFFGSMYEVESIVMVVDQLADIRNFMSAARAVSRVKPIIALKTGRTGVWEDRIEDAVYDAAFSRAGILRVDDFEALFDCAEFLAKQKRPKGARLAIVSNTKGLSTMACDMLSIKGFAPGQFSDETGGHISQILGGQWKKENPVNLPRGLQDFRKTYVKTAKTCMEAPEIDGLLLLNSQLGAEDVTSLARDLSPLLKLSPCPVLTAWMGGLDINNARSVLNRAGIVTYETPERAVRAFINLYRYGRNLEMLQQIPVRTDRRLEIKYDQAEQIIEQGLKGPEKLPDRLARDLAHAYGIPLGSGRENTPADYELFVSAVRHDDFGPVIRFGMGGIMTDVFHDVSLALPPLNRLLARTAVADTKISKVFSGYGSIRKIDIEILEELLIRISRLITDFPHIRALELNPIRVANGTIAATQGSVVLQKKLKPGIGRLIISPYPFWQEKTVRVKNGESVFIRPVRPTDAQQMIDLFDDLSAETVYLRFFSPLKEITRSMLIRFTQIDYDREIALVAFSGDPGQRKIIGVSRIIFMPEGNKAEFAIVLADKWQNRGLGIQLLHHALECSKKMGITTVWGPVISTNAGMLAMGQKLGFSVRHDLDSGEYKLVMSMDDLKPLALPKPGRK